MRTTQISARWTGDGLKYVGTDSKGNQVLMGGENLSPAQMVLLGLAGCMGMDIVSILQKKRQKVADVQVLVTAQQPDDYPRPYQTIDVVFVVKGENIDPKAVERAIELSEEKYCVVGQTLKGNPTIKATFAIEELLEPTV
jgi:putative redox protein